MENPGYPATPGLADATARLGRSLDAQDKRQAAEDARRRMEAAAPVMLAALQKLAPLLSADIFTDAPECAETVATVHVLADEARAAIAAATGSPAPAQSPPVDSDGKRTDTWNLVPGAQPEEDEGLSTYRITETAVYLVKAEDEAHAERRFVCEVGIHAESFHAVEGRTIELVEEGKD